MYGEEQGTVMKRRARAIRPVDSAVAATRATGVGDGPVLGTSEVHD
jgi:hypothetical protein